MNPLSPPPSKQVLSAAARVASLDLARLFRQHDRDAVANRISEFRRARDQFLLGRVEFKRSLGQRADQDFQEFGVYGIFEAFGRRSHRWFLRLSSPLSYPSGACRRAVIMAKQSSRARRARPAAAVWATACPRARSRETSNREFAPAPARSRAEHQCRGA